MKKIDFYASEIHYYDHMSPIWRVLPDSYKGGFYVSNTLYSKVKDRDIPVICSQPKGELTLVASYGDYCSIGGNIVYMEHGIGHSYSNKHPSYAGGAGKDRVVLFMNQHHITDKKNRLAYPKVINKIIGTPKMDSVTPRHIKNRVVCMSFHWNCQVCPETGSAFEYFKEMIPRMIKHNNFTLIMHGHPRPGNNWEYKLKKYGVKFYSDFKDILEIADIYVNDNSSTMYEFAAAGRPVIVLNSPHYREKVHHGIRFWDYILGEQVDIPIKLIDVIERTFEKPHEWDERRNRIVEELYPYRGESAQRASSVIIEYLEHGT